MNIGVKNIVIGSMLVAFGCGAASQYLAPNSFIGEFTSTRSGALLLAIIVFIFLLLGSWLFSVFGSTGKNLNNEKNSKNE